MNEEVLIEDVAWAFDAVFQDMRDNNGGNADVMTFPINSFPDPYERERAAVKRTMQQIFNVRGSIVVPAENVAELKKDVHTPPAAWASSTFPLTVAGAVDNTRRRTRIP